MFLALRSRPARSFSSPFDTAAVFTRCPRTKVIVRNDSTHVNGEAGEGGGGLVTPRIMRVPRASGIRRTEFEWTASRTRSNGGNGGSNDSNC